MKIKHLFLTALSGAIMASCNPEAKPSFTASDTEVVVGNPVTFTDNSEDSYDRIWDFGDGTTTADDDARVVSHIYADTGHYTVTLQVWDKRQKNSATSSEDIHVVRGVNFDDWTDEVNGTYAEESYKFKGLWTLSSMNETISNCPGDVPETETYSNVEINFVQQSTFIFTSEIGNVSTGFWNVIDDGLVEINGITIDQLGGNLFEYSLTESSLTLVQTVATTYTDINGDEQVCTKTRTWKLSN